MSNILIFIFIICLLLSVYNIYSINHIHEKNKQIDKENEMLKKRHSDLQELIRAKGSELAIIQTDIVNKESQLSDIQNNITKTLDNQKELSQQAYENYCEILQNKYNIEEEEYDAHIELLKESYSNLQLDLMREADECRKDLDKIRTTRAAAIEAQRKEEEMKANISFYCLQLSQEELDDIKKLERIKLDLHKPRILSMLIWSTYFQKQLKTLSVKILGTSSIVTGIYKITNQLDNKCYIGQSVDVAKRWSQHTKAGLGIDTPPHNKLYQAMLKDGIWNFSWELLEKCSKEELDEKEKFYINLYEAKEFGYNSTVGNK